MPLKINNRDARRLWLNSLGLGSAPTGPLDVLQIIKKLGFVQLDTIRNVSRAHHHILWSRNQHYREPMLGKLLAEDRAVFEHFTHDAAVLPMDFYPMWTRQFRRLGAQVSRSKYYRTKLNNAGTAAIKARIAKEGPLSTHAFDTKVSGNKEMWSRPPHKLALDHMWYSGELSTSHRENFKKFYDLSERVIPEKIINQLHSDEDQIDWLCRAALDRLSFAALGEIQRFWDAADSREVQAWAKSVEWELVWVEIESADGNWFKAVAPGDIEQRVADATSPTSRLRIINPFDPAIRDRVRLERLFGFDYRIEIFVPAAKRRWGYYVYPLLEGDRFVGRIEVKADRKGSKLNVVQLWSEPGTKWSNRRSEKLEAELARLARFVAAKDVCWTCGRDPS
ncbi:MAG: winged helix-turn-helix domain-containing protein [Pseudomonadales bacterium]